MDDFTIERLGKSDLTFTGELIGQSNGPNPLLKIYRTKAAKFVGELRKEPHRSEANHFDKPGDLVAWVQSRLNGIPEDAQAAIEKARAADKEFGTFWTEHVE
jgi:hypothetical protein